MTTLFPQMISYENNPSFLELVKPFSLDTLTLYLYETHVVFYKHTGSNLQPLCDIAFTSIQSEFLYPYLFELIMNRTINCKELSTQCQPFEHLLTLIEYAQSPVTHLSISCNPFPTFYERLTTSINTKTCRLLYINFTYSSNEEWDFQDHFNKLQVKLRPKQDQLFTLLSAREVKRVGTVSQIGKLPRELMRMLGEYY